MANEARFVIDRSREGQYYFFLRAENGENLITRETYTTKQSAENGIYGRSERWRRQRRSSASQIDDRDSSPG